MGVVELAADVDFSELTWVVTCPSSRDKYWCFTQSIVDPTKYGDFSRTHMARSG